MSGSSEELALVGVNVALAGLGGSTGELGGEFISKGGFQVKAEDLSAQNTTVLHGKLNIA